MTNNEYRKQLIKIGDAAAAEVDACERRLSRIRQAISEQRKRADKALARADEQKPFAASDLRMKSVLINSVLDAIEKELI